MRVAGIRHKAENGIECLLDKIEAVAWESDVVVAPEYALNTDLKRPNRSREYGWIFERLAEISTKHKALIIPGTMMLQTGRTFKVISPVYSGGQIIKEIQKERESPIESDISSRFRLEYKRGDNSQNYIPYPSESVKGSIAIEICKDHGNQVIPQDTVLEIILNHDMKSGFYQNIETKKFKRHIMINDSYHPHVDMYQFGEDERLGFWRPIRWKAAKTTEEGTKIFEI